MSAPFQQYVGSEASLRGNLPKTFYNVSIDAVGLVTAAELDTVALRAARTGTSSLLDALVICPGLHRQQKAPTLSQGEFPACAAMTTGYVFRVENEATVLFFQRVSKTGHLTTLSVSSNDDGQSFWKHISASDLRRATLPTVHSIAYALTILLSISALLLLLVLQDWYAIRVIGILVLVRLINIIVMKRRAISGWKGASEPGVNGDLLVLLSQDRWVRIRGAVDDLKAVTSGHWLREPTFTESSAVSFATILVYLNVALTWNATQEGKMILLALWLLSAALLGIANEFKHDLDVCKKHVKVDKPHKSYGRRLELARELIEETGRDDWAIRLGMVHASEDSSSNMEKGPKIM